MSVITKQVGKLEYLVAEGISVPHCFTTRLGGVSKDHLASLNLGIRRGDDPENVAENFRILGDAVGFSTEDLVGTRQVHSDIVWQVGRAQRGTALTLDSSPECDALITNEPGTGLVIYTADCTPILLHDPVTGAVGAVHAGWKGTAAAIGEKTVQAMVTAYGCNPADIHAAIGPRLYAFNRFSIHHFPSRISSASRRPYITPKPNSSFAVLNQCSAIAFMRSVDPALEASCDFDFSLSEVITDIRVAPPFLSKLFTLSCKGKVSFTIGVTVFVPVFASLARANHLLTSLTLIPYSLSINLRLITKTA